jgi:predicted transglutaminase-like cysteine proteinase
MHTYGEATPPKAFADFCERIQEACASLEMRNEEKMSRRKGDAKDLEELQRINIEVNGSIEPESDMKHIGVDDQWDDIDTSKDKKGDCEEFAILKRKRLMALGWRPSDLLMTVVSTGKGEGHAVLTARTKRGDFILDNRYVEVLAWQATKNRAEDPYTFFMRQSYLNPKIWLSLIENKEK